MRESCHRVLLPRYVYPIAGELMNVHSRIIDPVILVAMRSKLLPSHGAAQALQNAVDTNSSATWDGNFASGSGGVVGVRRHNSFSDDHLHSNGCGFSNREDGLGACADLSAHGTGVLYSW